MRGTGMGAWQIEGRYSRLQSFETEKGERDWQRKKAGPIQPSSFAFAVLVKSKKAVFKDSGWPACAQLSSFLLICLEPALAPEQRSSLFS